MVTLLDIMGFDLDGSWSRVVAEAYLNSAHAGADAICRTGGLRHEELPPQRG